MFTTISLQRLSAGSIYKLWFIGLATTLVPLGLVFGVLAWLGSGTVTWYGQNLQGVPGLLAAPLMGLFMAAAMTLVQGSAVALGLWLFSLFKRITLRAKDMAAAP